MEAGEASYLQVKALMDGDTVAGGLTNTSSSAYIRGGTARFGNPGRTRTRPFADIEVIDEEKSREQAGRQFDAMIRIRITSDRDKQRDSSETDEEAIEGRLATVLNGVSPATGSTGWNFSVMSRLRSYIHFDGKEKIGRAHV